MIMKMNKLLILPLAIMMIYAAAYITSNYSSKAIALSSPPQCFPVNKDNFTHSSIIDNPFFPIIPGTTYVFSGNSGVDPQSSVTKITSDTKTILGVKTVVVNDTSFVNGNVTESTLDWYAQDNDGNVWYFGEFTTEYLNGVVLNHDGSWQAGVNGAQAGIIMKGNPHVGDFYCQENSPGVAQDQAEVISLGESVCVAGVCAHGNVLKTKETTPLEPRVVAEKYYVSGFGLAKEQDVKGSKDSSGLVAVLH